AILIILFPYPEQVASFIYSVFFIAIYSFIIFNYRKTKLNLIQCILILSITICSLYPLILNFKIVVLKYILSAISLLYICVVKPTIQKNNNASLTILIINLVMLLSLYNYNPIENRLSIINGDPNYTALFYFCTSYVAIKLTTKKIIKLISILTFVYICYVTGSRMILLMALFFILSFFPISKYIIKNKKICYCIFVASVVLQPILAYLPNIDIILSQLFPYSADGSRLLNLADSSNFKRIIAAKDAIDFLLNFEAFFVGSNDYVAEANVMVIPHHWVLLPAVTYGAIFALLYTVMIFYCISLVPNATQSIAILSTLFIAGAILGSVPIVNCLPIILYFSYTKNENNSSIN
ncbi:hypothetical protein ACLPIF_21280, partial [Providencia sp. Me1]|uniref:hypothetical protein n=1 Tax=Providencia sp. Me1 TaxID=3392634 RepID=UPI003D2742B6